MTLEVISPKKHIAKRAIIMAAGIGQRMQPITLKIPKPLIVVNGTRMIDSIIKGLYENGITEIYIVVGYLKEQFQNLLNEYQGIKLIENPYFESCNNISSLYVAREYLEDCIIMDGDQIIYNTNILSKEFQRSGYCSIWTDIETKEWLQIVTDGIVTECSRTGGKNGWQLVSVSFWSKEDGEKLREKICYEFETNKNIKIYWDDIALFCYPNDFRLGIRPISKSDIIEIDSFKELLEIDESYSQDFYKNEKIEG